MEVDDSRASLAFPRGARKGEKVAFTAVRSCPWGPYRDLAEPATTAPSESERILLQVGEHHGLRTHVLKWALPSETASPALGEHTAAPAPATHVKRESGSATTSDSEMVSSSALVMMEVTDVVVARTVKTVNIAVMALIMFVGTAVAPAIRSWLRDWGVEKLRG
ncbi:uncharacterized protein B0H18DRAFT_954271 [Fomitopsis serialis]|uniref:uncharacterized protein n=1 Tax=Fomitopsis serialis TaxID=139415 RepID=UPI0020071FF8|nr:uncharacterized protein B0H18DRAFT_954271 [Neoantrodia serialis]KAH9927843.1 hypothetical protein B0H18DRAFT_954271 [Neoantrodia serialis]